MANIEIGVKVQEGDAIESLHNVDVALDDVGDTAKATSKKTVKSTKNMSIGMKAFSKGMTKANKAATKSFKGIQKGAKATAKAVKAIASAMTGPAGMVASLLGVGAAVAAFHKVLDDGKALQQMATNTGIAIDKLEEFRIMTVLMGGDMDALSDAVQDFSEKMGEASLDANSSWADAFNKIGVTITESVEPAINDTLRALAKMVDEGKKLTAFHVGVDLFGDAFKNTFASMISEGIEPFEQKLKDLQKLKAFDTGLIKVQQRFRDMMNDLKAKFGGFLITGITEVLPHFTALIKTGIEQAFSAFGLDSSDMVNAGTIAGEAIGDGISSAMKALFGPDGFIQKLQAGFYDMRIGMEKLVAKLKTLFNPEQMARSADMFGIRLEVAMVSALSTFKGGLAEAFNSLGELPGVGDAFKRAGKKLSGAVVDNSQEFLDDATTLLHKINNLGVNVDPVSIFTGSKDEVWNNVMAAVEGGMNELRDKGIGEDILSDLYSGYTKLREVNTESVTLEESRIKVLNTQLEVLQEQSDALEDENVDSEKILELQRKKAAAIALTNSTYLLYLSNLDKEEKARADALVEEQSITETVAERVDYHAKSLAIIERLKATTTTLGADMKLHSPAKADGLDLGAIFNLGDNADEFDSYFNNLIEGAKAKGQAILEVSMMYIDQFSNMMNSFSAIGDAKRQKDLDDYRKLQNDKLKTFKGSEEGKLQYQKKLDAETEKREKEIAERRKKMQIANLWIGALSSIPGIWSAVSMSLAQIPLGAGLPFIPGVAGGLTAAVLASAGAQSAAIAKYENGGIVPGNSMSGDKVNAKVNSGEMILNKEQQAQLFKIANNDSDQVNSNSIAINIEGDVTDDKLQQLEDMLYNLQSSNRFVFA